MDRFRWVACQIDYLCTLPHDRARREALNSLPPDLNSTYERILGRVVKQPLSIRRIVRDTLLWTMRAAEPLTTAALCEALSVEESSTHLDEESRPDEEVVLEYCSSLLRKAVSGEHLELAHFTVQEYLCSDILRENEELAFFSTETTKDINRLARVCLTYLVCEDFSHVLMCDYKTWQTFNSAHPFHLHASQYWNRYASVNEDGQSIRELVRVLFCPRKSPHFTNWSQCFTVGTGIAHGILPEKIFFDATAIVRTGGASKLHFAAILQLEWLMKWLLDEGYDVNQMSQIGTPLHCALLGFHAIRMQSTGSLPCDILDRPQLNHAILRLVSTFHADPTISYKYGDGQDYNALAICMITMAKDALEEILDLFPRWTTCFDGKCLEILEKSESMLWIVDSLDERYLDPCFASKISDLTKGFGWCTKESDLTHNLGPRSETEKTLSLRQDIRLDAIKPLEALLRSSPKSVNEVILSEGTTALHLAVVSNSPKATNLLLALGANIEEQDDYGQTALHKCVYGSSVDIFGILLDKGANPSKADNMGSTVWHLAAGENSVAILQVLLQQDAPEIMGISKTDSRGLTPLFTAVEAGSEQSLLLLSQFTDSFEGKTEDGLEFAHFAICLSLSTCQYLVKKGLDLNVRSNDGSTVLHYITKVLPQNHAVDNRKEILAKIQYLVDMGQSLSAINDHGQNPLQTLLSRNSWMKGTGKNHPTGEHLPRLLDAKYSSALPSRPSTHLSTRQLIDSLGLLGEGTFLSIVEALSTKETVNNRDYNGITTLELFCSHKSLEKMDKEVLEALFTMGADSAVRCSSGQMPLQVLFESRKNYRDASQETEFLDLLLVMLKHMDDSNELFRKPLAAQILELAVRASHQSLTKELLAKGVSPCRRPFKPSHDSVLDDACKRGVSTKIIRDLLESCVEEARSILHPVTGYNLLHILCSKDSMARDLELMEVCIKMGFNIEARDKEFKNTPLLLAIQNADAGKLDFARLLCECGANIFVQNSEGHSAAYFAIRSGSLAAVQLVDEMGALYESPPRTRTIDISIPYSSSKRLQISGTLWHLAAGSKAGAADILRYLFQRGVVTHIDYRTRSGETALQISSFKGDVQALRYLISKGADLQSSNRSGQTALHFAAESGQVSIIQVLHSVGAKMDSTTSTGMLPLHYAVMKGGSSAVDELLKRGSPYFPDKKQMTPYVYRGTWLPDQTRWLLHEHELRNLGRLMIPQATSGSPLMLLRKRIVN